MAAIQIDGVDATLTFIEDEDSIVIPTTNGFLVNYKVFIVDPVVDGVLSIESWE